jgi:hypothetical protein
MHKLYGRDRRVTGGDHPIELAGNVTGAAWMAAPCTTRCTRCACTARASRSGRATAWPRTGRCPMTTTSSRTTTRSSASSASPAQSTGRGTSPVAVPTPTVRTSSTASAKSWLEAATRWASPGARARSPRCPCRRANVRRACTAAGASTAARQMRRPAPWSPMSAKRRSSARSSPHPHGLANSSGLVGKGLLVHSSDIVFGRMPEPVSQFKAPPPSTITQDFYETDPANDFAQRVQRPDRRTAADQVRPERRELARSVGRTGVGQRTTVGTRSG